MKFKNLYNPDKVYEDYFEAFYIRPFIHHYTDFGGHESARSFWMSALSWTVLTLGLAGALMGLVGLLGPEVGFDALIAIGVLWGAFSLVPWIALIVRAFHGPDGKKHKRPRFLGVDMLLTCICLLFFVTGLLMMVTTLNSETLDPNHNYVEEADTVKIEKEEVIEEPIFTYQDPAPAREADTLLEEVEEEDPDALSPDESFDPTLEPTDEYTDTIQ